MLIKDSFEKPFYEIFVQLSTLIITQQDSRTMFSDSAGTCDPLSINPIMDTAYFGSYSDRINMTATGFPVTINTPPQSTWHLPQSFSNRDTDPVNVTIEKPGDNDKFIAHFRLLRWGPQFDLTFNLIPQTGMYQAFGPTIGNAPGQALYSMCFR